MASSRLPILFEALPPRRDATHGQWQDQLELLDPLLHLGIEGVNVPEIVNGHYETVEPRAFAVALQARLRVKAIVNRITVHHPLPDLLQWVQASARDFGIRDFVFVGGERRTEKYPGPSLSDALPYLAAAAKKAGGQAGVITIPTRRRPDLDEPSRLLAKQAAGASFAVSQILCESTFACRLQADLAGAADAGGEAQMPVYWSLAPAGKKADVEFLGWLGVHVPPEFVSTVMDGGATEGRLARSRAWNLRIARDLLEHAERVGAAPRFCVEHVMQHNIEAAVDLVEGVAALLREFPQVGGAVVRGAR